MKQLSSFFQKNTANFSAQTVLFSALLLFAGTTPAQAQTTWIFGGSGSWYSPSSWSAGVPDANDDVIIQVGTPVIVNGTALAKSITVQSGAALNISSGATLIVQGGTTQGILNSGTITNSGILQIGPTSSPGSNGIKNNTTFNNNATGNIFINRSTAEAILQLSGTFTNQGIITIGDVANTGTIGISNHTNFNNTGGQIRIDRSTSIGLVNQSTGTFNNQNSASIPGIITIGANAVTGTWGMTNQGIFNNKTGSQINIDQFALTGLDNTSGTFTNQATITIGGVASPGNTKGINNNGTFNNTGGTITVDRSGNFGITNSNIFNNQATITIGATVGSGSYGLSNSGTFNNNSGGQLHIDRSAGGILNSAGTFTNRATINIGAVDSPGGFGVENLSTFDNLSGQLNINRTTSAGFYNRSGTATNTAMITIGGLETVGLYGWRNGNATFNNNTGGQLRIDRFSSVGINCSTSPSFINNQATITIGATQGGNTGMSIFGSTNNNTGGQIHIDRCTSTGISTGSGSTFTNYAAITIGNLAPIPTLVLATSGTFSNNIGATLKGTGAITNNNFSHAGGALSPGYSPGKMTFSTATNFSNSTLNIEVNGSGVAGTDFDQVVVSGAATLGGKLNLSFNYPAPADGTQIMILNATSLSGTFSLVTGLPSGWAVNYNVPSAGKVSLVYTVVLPVELTGFSARPSGSSVQLDWQTASEHHNAGFYIERSADGLRWSEIGFVAGQGDATAKHDYTFPDEKPFPGLNYYRLRQTDLDGKEEISRVISVKMPGSERFLSVFPNPVSQGACTMRFSGKTVAEALEVRLYNAAGQLVKSDLVNPESDLKMDLTSLPSGMYILELWDAGEHFCEKVVVH